MRYLTLTEGLLIASAVTGIEVQTIQHVSRVELLDSALHAPQAGFGDEDFYPTLDEKAAVLCLHLARNHPLPDGNKRLAWMATVMFLRLNNVDLAVNTETAVSMIIRVASGVMSQSDLTEWIGEHRSRDNI
jgi:death-on-curing protein